MLFNLTEPVVKNILIIVDKATISGAEAQAVIDIKRELSTPVNPSVQTGAETPAKQ